MCKSLECLYMLYSLFDRYCSVVVSIVSYYPSNFPFLTCMILLKNDSLQVKRCFQLKSSLVLHVNRENKNATLRIWEYETLRSDICMSGCWESNPRHQLGRLRFYH